MLSSRSKLVRGIPLTADECRGILELSMDQIQENNEIIRRAEELTEEMKTKGDDEWRSIEVDLADAKTKMKKLNDLLAGGQTEEEEAISIEYATILLRGVFCAVDSLWASRANELAKIIHSSIMRMLIASGVGGKANIGNEEAAEVSIADDV
jgi:hypothetical protein